MGNNTTQLDAHVNTLGGPDLAANVLSNEPTQIDRGNQILGGIFFGHTNTIANETSAITLHPTLQRLSHDVGRKALGAGQG